MFWGHLLLAGELQHQNRDDEGTLVNDTVPEDDRGVDLCSVSASSPSKLLECERQARAPSGLFQSLTFFGFPFLGVSCFIFTFGAGIDCLVVRMVKR